MTTTPRGAAVAPSAPTTRRSGGSEQRERRAALVTLLPPTLWLLFFMGAPLLITLAYSFYTLDASGVMRPEFTLANYGEIVRRPIFGRILQRTIEITLVATAIALVIAYPMGYTLGALVPRHRQVLLLLLVIVPFWTSYIVRTYGWIGVLQKNGLIESLATTLTGRVQEFGLLYSRFAVILGFIHVFLPLLILPIFASARNIDPRLIEAAQDLGASPQRTFLRVGLPLTLPGVAAGVLLFFISVFGAFVTPQLLGGTSDLMIGNITAQQFGESFNWPLGSALSMLLTTIVVAVIIVFLRFADLESIYG